MDTQSTTSQFVQGEMEKYSKYEKKDAAEHFNKLAENYDQVYQEAGYPDPKLATEYVQHYTKELGKSDTAHIMDFGCGTGMVGEKLAEAGYKNIYGLDISEKMVEIADGKDVYRAVDVLDLGQKDFQQTLPNFYKNRFEFITCTGLITNHHMDENIFEQMLLSLKDKGVFVFTAQHSFMGRYWYQDKLEILEKLGRIKLLKSENFFDFENMHQSIGKFQRTPMKIFAYQKTEMDTIMAFKRASTMKQEDIMALLNQGVRKAFADALQKAAKKKLQLNLNNGNALKKLSAAKPIKLPSNTQAA